MNTYKNESTMRGVEAVYNFFQEVTELNKELARVNELYGISKTTDFYVQKIGEKFKQLQADTFEIIEGAANAARKRASYARENSLSVGNAEKDFALLGLPVKLTPDELRVMVNRNPDNLLFARAVSEYAEKNGYEGIDFKAMKNKSTHYEQMIEAANKYESTLKKYCSGESVNGVQFMYSNAMSMLESKHVFDEL